MIIEGLIIIEPNWAVIAYPKAEQRKNKKMRTITKDELDIILEKHKSYLVGVYGGEKADLSHANLIDADLHGADLSGANLSGTYLDEKEQCRKGVILKKPMMGYKKLADGSICVLSIPKGAVVFSINGSKCRTNKAKVLEGGGVSYYDNEFTYEKGKSYEIEDFDLAYNEECSTGIHFFKTRKEAEEYGDN